MDVLLHRLPPLRRAVLTRGQGFDEETVSEQIMNNKRRVPYLFCSAARPCIDRALPLHRPVTPDAKKTVGFNVVAGGPAPPEPYGLVVSG
ncbi:hypothetical protein [Azospirillum brasilense]|uniref:hypothetical protein n=1 Tax=Azospirillum brasilense TaxID=192 RepID=UPI001EDAF64D|nr:hypothetical protein [Azospirillum brasilense]UKJ72619.1 hypothetical protein H1Q64_10915 [Azospirillum brasilense]